MFGLKKRPRERDPAVAEAMAERDLLLVKLGKAVKKVDRIQNELIAEYERANGLHQGE